jgi:hypothetical protein
VVPGLVCNYRNVVYWSFTMRVRVRCLRVALVLRKFGPALVELVGDPNSGPVARWHQGYRALSNAAGPQPPHDQQQQLAPRRRRSGCLAFGEIIFDCFGDGSSVVGGAPLNFAVNLQQLGLEVGMVSALGRDQLGAAARSYMGSCGVDAALVHESPRPTGQVNVTIGGDGEARYDVDLEASWSEIHGPGGPPSSFSRPELLYIGSTARQTPHNAAAVRDLVTRLRPVHVFFDLNLRPGLYAPESVSQNG